MLYLIKDGLLFDLLEDKDRKSVYQFSKESKTLEIEVWGKLYQLKKFINNKNEDYMTVKGKDDTKEISIFLESKTIYYRLGEEQTYRTDAVANLEKYRIEDIGSIALNLNNEFFIGFYSDENP